MHLTSRMEQFNIAYVGAITAQAGFSTSKLSVDDDSIDLTISAKATYFPEARFRSPKIDLQLKCTSTVVPSDGVLRFPLPIKNYDDLRGDNFANPRYLCVLVVPRETQDWAICTEDAMILSRVCYWVSIKDYKQSPNQKTVTIDIPTSQKLTSSELIRLMECASKGEWA